MSEVKSLLDSIIDNTDNSFQNHRGPVFDKDTVGTTITRNTYHPQTFDSGKFREKLSLYVLHDLVTAMMHDETNDLDGMIDSSIMRHIHDDYSNGSCYGYLCNARDRLKSPLVADIIQEIDDKTDEVKDGLNDTKDEDLMNGEIDVKELLKDVKDYDEFRDKIKDNVSKKVVNDVANVITQRNDAPVFDDLDNELQKKDKDDVKEENDATQESVIFKMCGAIVTESAINKERISTEEGLNRAIVEYCINQMDFLFKANPKVPIYSKYKI